MKRIVYLNSCMQVAGELNPSSAVKQLLLVLLYCTRKVFFSSLCWACTASDNQKSRIHVFKNTLGQTTQGEEKFSHSKSKDYYTGKSQFFLVSFSAIIRYNYLIDVSTHTRTSSASKNCKKNPDWAQNVDEVIVTDK